MIPISASKVRRIVNGKLVTGLDDQLILDVERFLEDVEKPNMLIFIWGKAIPDMDRIKKYSPCTIITSQFFKEYKIIDKCTVILVNNVVQAYWDFVKYYRDSFDIPVIAITGTSGKTTTKEMIKHILSRYLNITATVGNLNGCGRSLNYLLNIDNSIEAAVFETAVSQPGDVTIACSHFRPTIGMITNIGTYHLDGCRTVENYIKAKAEMVSGMDPNGTLILNSDDEKTRTINLENFKGCIIYFGIKNKAHFQATNIKYRKNKMKFHLIYENFKYPVSVQGYGEHQVYNALGAIAAVNEIGIDIKKAAKILSSFKSLPKRLEVHKGINGSIIVDDTWNYNLSGLTAAIEALVNNIAKDKKKVLMLGGLGKLGEHSSEIINAVGNLIVDNSIDNLIIIGDTAEAVANVIKKRGGRTKVYIFINDSGMYDLLKELLDKNTAVLVKCYRNEYSKPLLESLKKIIKD